MIQSANLTKFYNAYNDWQEAGAPEHNAFEHWFGLCTSLRRWCQYQVRLGVAVDSWLLTDEMTDQFRENGLDTNYPFGRADFEDCLYHDTMHLSPKRIAWVKAHLSA